jgi:hypothetical protein
MRRITKGEKGKMKFKKKKNYAKMESVLSM